MPELHRCKSQTFEQVQCCTILVKVPWNIINHNSQISMATKTRWQIRRISTDANLCNPCCSSTTMQLLFSYQDLWWNKWLEATNTNINNCMGRILVQYCLVKCAMILAQNENRIVSRTGSRKRFYLSFIQPLHSIHVSYCLKFCNICLIILYILTNFFNNRYLAAPSLLLMNLKVCQSPQKQTIQDALWYESGLSYFLMHPLRTFESI